MFRAFLCGLILAVLSLTVSAQDIPLGAVTIPFPADSLVSFSPDLRQMVIVKPSQDIQIYKSTFGELLMTVPFEGEGRMVSVRWKGDNSAILLVTRTAIYRMDAGTGESTPIAEFSVDNEILGADFFQENAIVARVSTSVGPSDLDDHETYVWDDSTLEQTLFLPADDDCLLNTYDDPYAAEVVRFLRGNPTFLDWCSPDVTWSPDQSRYIRWLFWNYGTSSPIDVYDTASGEVLFTLNHCPSYDDDDLICDRSADLEQVSWSPDGSKIASVPLYTTGTIKIWDAKTGTLLHKLMTDPSNEPLNAPITVRWHGETQIAGWGPSGYIYVWDVGTGELMYEWFHAKNVVLDTRWIYDDKLVMAWGEPVPWSYSVGGVWNAATGDKLALIYSDSGKVKDVISDPVRFLLYVQFADHIDVWDMEYFSRNWNLDGEE